MFLPSQVARAILEVGLLYDEPSRMAAAVQEHLPDIKEMTRDVAAGRVPGYTYTGAVATGKTQ